MKHKYELNLILITAYIAFWVGFACCSVGETCEGGVYSWHLPIVMFLVLIVPFVLGYEIGKDKRK